MPRRGWWHPQKMGIPSGNLTWLWKDPPFLMGKSTISMAIFNSYVSLPEGNDLGKFHHDLTILPTPGIMVNV